MKLEIESLLLGAALGIVGSFFLYTLASQPSDPTPPPKDRGAYCETGEYFSFAYCLMEIYREVKNK